MTDLNTTFERMMLTQTLKDLRGFCALRGISYKELRKESWGYIVSDRGQCEFQINACNSCPEGYYNYNIGARTLRGAVAMGFSAWMEKVRNWEDERELLYPFSKTPECNDCGEKATRVIGKLIYCEDCYTKKAIVQCDLCGVRLERKKATVHESVFYCATCQAKHLHTTVKVLHPVTDKPIKRSEWCICKEDSQSIATFYDDGECDCGCHKHHWHCPKCGRISQVG
jgi:hypothetical protein